MKYSQFNFYTLDDIFFLMKNSGVSEDEARDIMRNKHEYIRIKDKNIFTKPREEENSVIPELVLDFKIRTFTRVNDELYVESKEFYIMKLAEQLNISIIQFLDSKLKENEMIKKQQEIFDTEGD